MPFLFLSSFVLSAEISRPEPKSGNDFYNIFPKEGADLPQAVDFIKETVGADDLYPWTDVQNHLKHWTVEASAEEVVKLQGHVGIEKVSKLELPPARAHVPAHETRQVTQGEQYLIRPVDGKNQEQNNATDTVLRGMLKDRIRKPHFSKLNGKLSWWVATLNADEVNKVKGITGVRAVSVDQEWEPCFVIPKVHSPSLRSPLEKRAITHTKQPDAVSELVAISQPTTVPKLEDLKDYVYETHNGEGIFVYHIEQGVAFVAQKAEFPHVAPEHILTEFAEVGDKKPEIDDNPRSHGTCTAGKAVGKEYGAAKKATLVVVRLYDRKSSEVIEALELVAADIRRRPERRKKCVVTMSIGNMELKDNDIDDLKENLKALFELDVPVVATAGNQGENPNRRDVDRYPGLLGGGDLPIIVVGSVDSNGQKSSFSQGGPCVHSCPLPQISSKE